MDKHLNSTLPADWKTIDALAIFLIGAILIVAILLFLSVFELIHADAVTYVVSFYRQ